MSTTTGGHTNEGSHDKTHGGHHGNDANKPQQGNVHDETRENNGNKSRKNRRSRNNRSGNGESPMHHLWSVLNALEQCVLEMNKTGVSSEQVNTLCESIAEVRTVHEEARTKKAQDEAAKLMEINKGLDEKSDELIAAETKKKTDRSLAVQEKIYGADKNDRDVGTGTTPAPNPDTAGLESGTDDESPPDPQAIMGSLNQP
jgi:hypothetical protein